MLSIIRRYIKRCLTTIAIGAIGAGLSSCDSFIFDGEGDCSVHYRLSFKYTKNVLKTDAFASQVTDVNVALYDRSGNLVLRKSDRRQLSEVNDYYLEVDLIPGVYDVIAWCSGPSLSNEAISFQLEGQEQGAAMTASGATLPLSGSDSEAPYSNKDIHSLYYGRLEGIEFKDADYGVIDITPVALTKDTNRLTVIMQNINSKPIDPSQLTYTLEAQNSMLGWQNNLLGDTKFNYIPWDLSSILTSEESTSTRADMPTGLKAEFSTGRLMADVEQYLSVKVADTGREILRIPLIQYLMLVRGNYNQYATAQDYLDCCDEYSLVFFIDEGFGWVKSRVIINGWRVVPPQNQDF